MKKILSVFGLLGLVSVGYAFSDVSNDHPNYSAISELEKLSIIAGYPDGTFKPSNEINRAELTKIIVGAVNDQPIADEFKNCFPDVQEEWFAPYICYAKAQGWVSGYPDGTFQPANNVLKVESTKIVMNAFGAVPDVSDTPLYDDVDNSQWFAPFIRTAKSNGILEETGANYAPAAKITRAQVSENIYRSKNVFSQNVVEDTLKKDDNSTPKSAGSVTSSDPALIGKTTVGGSTVQSESGTGTGGSSSSGNSESGTNSGSGSGSGGGPTPPPEPTSVVWDGCSIDAEKTTQYLPEGSESQFFKCNFTVAFSQEEGESIDPAKVFSRITLHETGMEETVFSTGFGGETGTIIEGDNGDVSSFSVWFQVNPLSVMHALHVPVFKGANLFKTIELVTQ